MTAPRLAADAAPLVSGDAIVFSGARFPSGFSGRGVPLLARLLPLLDGTRSIDELAAELGVSSRVVDQALGALRRKNLLEAPPLTLWLRGSGAAAISRLLAAELDVRSDGAPGEADSAGNGRRTVVVTTDDDEDRRLRDLDPAVRTLRLRIGSGWLDVGPRFGREETCSGCWRPGEPPAPQLTMPVLDAIVAERAALVAIAEAHGRIDVAPFEVYRLVGDRAERIKQPRDATARCRVHPSTAGS